MNHPGKKCVPCGAMTQPLALKETKALLAELKGGWSLAGSGKVLRQELAMKDFMAAVHFINAVARAAEAEGHHPDLHLTGYRNLVIELSTHAMGGLSMNDFVLAEKINGIHRELKALARRGHAVAA
jgi:4a-hydroxytetrahydrobiopterin dehydratase